MVSSILCNVMLRNIGLLKKNGKSPGKHVTLSEKYPDPGNFSPTLGDLRYRSS